MFRNFEKYEVYEDGRIWSYKTNKFLKPATLPNGYQVVALYDNEGEKKLYYLHRVVYESVTGEPIPKNLECNHINECKSDNRFCNINLLTPKENTNWGTGIIRCAKARINGKLSKAVGAFKDGKLVMTFPSTAEAGRNGFDSSAVGKCCNGKLPHYKGYTWKYL